MLNDLTAIEICEGIQDASEEETLDAWQHLVDTGLAWKLQGSFGRHAEYLISTGFIEAPLNPPHKNLIERK